MADAWSARTAALRAALEAQGLDVVAPLNLRWYNEVAPETARVAPAAVGAGEDALAVLVGNSRALWPAFTAAHDSDPAIGDAEHPVDTFVARAIRDAIADASNGACGRTASVVRVFDAHDTSPGKLVAIQRAAHVAGVAHLDESCHLSIHPTLGPWLAFRAVLVFDDVAGPDRGDVPPTPPNPLADDPIARRRVDDAFGAALAGYEDPDGGRETQWRRWVAVRDAVRPGHPERYGEEQVRYHYNCLDGRERERIRTRLRRSSRARDDDAGERRGENDREGGPDSEPTGRKGSASAPHPDPIVTGRIRYRPSLSARPRKSRDERAAQLCECIINATLVGRRVGFYYSWGFEKFTFEF